MLPAEKGNDLGRARLKSCRKSPTTGPGFSRWGSLFHPADTVCSAARFTERRDQSRPCQAVTKVVIFSLQSPGGSKLAVRIAIDLATEADRQEIYRLRHQVYAVELHQHRENSEACLSDPLDAHNTYSA